MNEYIPDCRECEDGANLYQGERCLECGRSGKKERPETRQRRIAIRQEAMRKIASVQFQEFIRVARRTCGMPEAGLSREETLNRLFCAYWACLTTYLWTLEPFQRNVLDIENQEEREKYFRQMMGAHASLLAHLSYPNNRSGYFDWLMALKLIAARFSSWLGVDNVPEIFLYIICPELSPPQSWQLHPIKEKRDDPLLRQMEHFVLGNLPLDEKILTKRSIRQYLEAAAYFAYRIGKGESTWEENRRMFAALFPALGSEYAKKHQIRANRAAARFVYKDVLLEVISRHFEDSETSP